MEPPDVPLIEISSEVDSFLHQIPSGDFTGAFDCSPLHLPRSSITKVNEECRGLSRSSSYGNKENLNTTDGKSGMSNLSIERQRMKRSRKDGGSNLRKSLAWNRAFLTEEGVLDSSELSMISGTIGKLDRENLSVIGEGRDLSSLNSDNARPSANLKTFEKDLHEEFSSGYANKRSSTHGLFLKRDSLAGRSLASVSKSSQKIPLTRSGSRSVSKGGVTSSPMLRSSQKRLLTVGSTQAVTHNSKIPKIPVLKQDTCQPHMIINDTSCGSCLKPIGVAQPATQKSPSLKASSTMKNASAVKARVKDTPMSAKPSTKSARNVTIKSNSETHTSKTSKHLEMTSNKELSIDVVNVIDRACGISGTVVSTHSGSVNVGGSQKNVQEKGLRPSGLRKPSPSLRYFSEPKFPVSNAPLKVDIRPSNLPKPSNSTSRNHTPDNHDRYLNEDEYSQQKAKYPASLMNEERDNNDCKRALLVESAEGNSRASIVFQELETSTDENISENSFKPCLDVQIINDSERNRNGEQQFVEDMGYISSFVNREVTLGLENEGTETYSTEFNKEEKHNQAVRVEYRQLHVDNPRDITVEAELSTDVSECIKVQNDLGRKDDSLLMNENLFNEEEFSLKFKNHGSREILDTDPEVARYKLAVVNDGFETASTSYQDNVQPACDGSQLSSIADDNQLPRKSNIPSFCQNVQIGGREDFFPNEIQQQTSLNLDEDDFDVLECDDGVVSINKPGGATYSLFDSEKNGRCSTNCTTVEEYNNDLSTIKVGEHSEMEQDDVSTMNDTLLADGALFFKNEQFMLKSENHNKEETSSANADFQTQRQRELKRKSIESYITEVLIDDAIEVYYSSTTSQGGDIQTQSSYRHKTFNSYGSDHATSVEYNQIAEVTNDANNQVHEKQPMAQNNDVDLTIGIVSEHNSLKKDRRESLAGMCMEIEDQTSDRKLPISPVIGCDTEEPSSSGETCELQSRNAFMKASLDDSTEHNKTGSSLSPTECETTISEDKNAMNCTNEELANSKQETYPNDQKRIGPPPNVIPFSDEWLAAIEAAGEEILTMKTGAVQNSPPDKPITEPSPWSPVKRKNNQVIGPFDCTKNTNFLHNNSG